MRRIVLRQVVFVLAVFAVLVLAGWFAGEAAKMWLTRSELPVLSFFLSERNAALTPWVQVLTNLGSSVVLVPLAVAAILVQYRAGRRREALFVALVAVGIFALSNTVKVLVDRPRPLVSHLVATETFSFPSSHSADALAIYVAIAYTIGRHVSTSLKALTWTVAVFVVTLVGWTRLYLGVHYISDVVGGDLLAAGWTIAAIRLVRGGPARPP